MARPKSLFLEDLAVRAQSDLNFLKDSKIALKLKAIIAATKHSISIVAEIFGVVEETIWRWGTSYRKEGLDGLYPKPRRPNLQNLLQLRKLKYFLGWMRAKQRTENIFIGRLSDCAMLFPKPSELL